MHIKLTILDLLKRQREKLNISQDALGSAIGTSGPTVSTFLLGRTELGWWKFVQLLEALNYPIIKWITNEGNLPAQTPREELTSAIIKIDWSDCRMPEEIRLKAIYDEKSSAGLREIATDQTWWQRLHIQAHEVQTLEAKSTRGKWSNARKHGKLYESELLKIRSKSARENHILKVAEKSNGYNK